MPRNTLLSWRGSSTISIVVDTAPLVAAADRSDPRSKQIGALLQIIMPDAIIPDPVVVEASWLMAERISTASARRFLADVAGGALRRAVLDDALFAQAAEYDRTFDRLHLGIADGAVMALAERERAEILTFDFTHFRATRPLKGGFWRLVIDEQDFRKMKK